MSIRKKAGSRFSAFGGELTGKILYLRPNRTIVQTWRSSSFKKGDRDSILSLNFYKAAGGAQVHLEHVQVPNHDYAGVNKGWKTFYWKPWAAYLKKKKR